MEKKPFKKRVSQVPNVFHPFISYLLVVDTNSSKYKTYPLYSHSAGVMGVKPRTVKNTRSIDAHATFSICRA